MKTVKELFGTLMTFLSSTGLVYFGCIAYAIFIWVISPRPLGWTGWILVGVFIQKNMELIRPWAIKQWKDLKSKIIK